MTGKTRTARMRHRLVGAKLALAASLILGCDDSSTGPTTGAIRILISTGGVLADFDPNGYVVSVDGGAGVSVASNTVLTIPDLSAGDHLVLLDAVASNCTVGGTNPRSVNVTPGDDASSTISVVFSVSCAPRVGNIQVSTVTSGADPDLDGYSVDVAGTTRGDVPANGSRSILGVREGQYSVRLTRLSGNCRVEGPNPKSVTVTYGATVDVAFAVLCELAGALHMTLSTTGVEPDADGYGLALRLEGVDSSTTLSVPSNGIATASGLLPGVYHLTISGLSANCDAAFTNPREITVTPGTPTSITLSVVCAATRQLAFAYDLFGDAAIYVINSNGTGATRLTMQLGRDQDPAWSPDGSRIAFASRRDGNLEIYVMNANGTNAVRLTNVSAADFRPAWSPDGSKIAFVSQRDGSVDIYVMNADGTGTVRLTNHVASDTDPAWSPDGSRIAFASDRTGSLNIHVMNADGSGVVQLTSNILRNAHPAWSPDGTRIAFSTAPSSGTRGIFVMSADGSGVTQLIQSFNDVSDPAWSPDGRKIAFAESTSCYYYYYYCESTIEVVGIDGTRYSRVTGVLASDPAWRP